MSRTRQQLLHIYDRLLDHFGPQGWWPAESAQEMIIGSILVQHTTWKGVENAIASLKEADLLNFAGLAIVPDGHLAALVKPAGTPRVKSQRLKGFAQWLGHNYDFDLGRMCEQPRRNLRIELLSVKGIGPETADCILLYAANQPVFVVDNYTQRILTRHGLTDGRRDYDEFKALFEDHLPHRVGMFKEYHALLVAVGKVHCRQSPICDGCPLQHLAHEVP